jgi:hypothetical protein
MSSAIQTWLDLPVPGLFLVLVVLFAGTGFLIVWTALRSPLRNWAQSYTGVVAPFFTAVGLLFALQLGFLGADVAERNQHAARAVNTEAHALRAAQTLSLAAASDMTDIREAMRHYLQSVLRDEWPIMISAGASPRTDAALATLLREASDPRVGQEAGQAPHTALLAALVQASQGRSDRLALAAADRTNELKWAAVLLLALMTQFAVAQVHLDKPRAMAAAVSVFTAAAVVAIGLVALQEQPFDGPMQILPTPLETFLAALPAPTS